MPEGDTIHRAAARLRQAIAREVVEHLAISRWSGPTPQAGETIEDVEARGKYLLIRFSGGLTLETHMKMTGSWHLYHPGSRWQKPRERARVVIAVPRWEAVCFNAPVARFVRSTNAGRQDLGPDLCTDDVAFEDLPSRAHSLVAAQTEIADVLLDQRVASGIGNVYKSEVLWALRVSPFSELERIDDSVLIAIYERASRLLRHNLTTNQRETVPGGLAVYGRRGSPCRRCTSAVRRAVQGPHARSTYWCPTCQPDPGKRTPRAIRR